MHGKRLREIDSASKAGSTCVPCCKAWHMGKITGAAFTGYKCYKVRQESCEIFLGSVITLVLGTWYILLISAARVPWHYRCSLETLSEKVVNFWSLQHRLLLLVTFNDHPSDQGRGVYPVVFLKMCVLDLKQGWGGEERSSFVLLIIAQWRSAKLKENALVLVVRLHIHAVFICKYLHFISPVPPLSCLTLSDLNKLKFLSLLHT
jgi:hypothetical protein